MARPALKVTHKPIDTTRLPDRLLEGAALLIELVRRGAIEQLAQGRVGKMDASCSCGLLDRLRESFYGA